VLRLRANGRFSSPVSKDKQDPGLPSPGATKKRGRPRKSKESESPKTLTVRLSYGRDGGERADTGQRIDRIMAGQERVQVTSPKEQITPKKPRTPRKPAKATHPFFLGKPKEPPTAKHESPRKASATTPGKLRRQVFGDRIPELQSIPEVPYAVGSALLKDRLMVKHPGAREPAWPAREQAHVRGLSESETGHKATLEITSTVSRKQKGAQLPFPQEHSILRQIAGQLHPEQGTEVRDDGFHEPHPGLRLPSKLLLSGHSIRERSAPELSASLRDDDADELLLPTSSQPSAHPALKSLWDRLPATMTAWDEGRGEPLGWAHKYAPNSAAEVLQPSREVSVLKDWLASLTVTAVESASSHPVKVTKPEPKPKKKRRRKADEMDDFLVADDEEMRDMDVLTDPEDLPAGSQGKVQRSLVQVASDGTKLSNAVLLSGPHGCGKTAAAYAVAKELGFRVFEIYSHERRNGKDVLDRVGDMTENHLVKHHGHVDPGELSASEEPNKARLDEAFERDLASGRQGKMSAFFKPKMSAPAVPKTKPKPKPKAKIIEAVHNAIKKAPKDQPQSLILLEEVDILFKDDKEFWNTVFKLIATSKRPFIMTCNDEDLVPYQAMNLHAILRFSPPALDLAVDYLLVVAASEGHLLKRSAVSALYSSKGKDFRASINELDLWCQMGIGDPRGGLTWIYQRWPPGSDVDEHGRKLRVVSEGTYQNGMGLLPDGGLDEVEHIIWAWQKFSVEPAELLQWHDPDSDIDGTAASRFSTLKAYYSYAETLSSMDAFSGIGLPDTAPLDPTQPELPDKARHHYIEGMALLQTDERTDYSNLTPSLVAATTSHLARSSGSCLILQNPSTAILHPSPSPSYLNRRAFTAFDPISTAPESALSTGPSTLVQSVFDGPLTQVTTDIAPYVRSIVSYDLALEAYRDRMAGMLGDGPSGRNKRARTTRAARSAMEGSQRSSTRRERWFTKGLDLEGVLATGGKEWPRGIGEAGGGVPGSRDGSLSVDGES
jgi:DNA polymerase III delta prime subunit